jgi:prepilin-type N-terminal cleavage/methylation domain-containing protein
LEKPNQKNMKKNQTSSVSSQGYSLLELVLVLAIVSVLVGLLLPKGFDALRNARIQQVEKTVDTLKTALTDYLSMAGGNREPTRTEGTGIPTSGAALTGATDVAKGNAARLDTVLLRDRQDRKAARAPHGHAIVRVHRHRQ